MNTFRTIDELVKSLDREKKLLSEVFDKRKSLSFRYDFALEFTEYKEERIRYLIDYGIIRESGNFLEMEDIYLNFFEEVLQVNEEINVSFVQDYLNNLKENIEYYLKENNENRKYSYQREVKRCLKNIALTTIRNIMDLKRNIDNTYKSEPNYQIKIAKLKRLDEKRRNIALLITKTEEEIDYKQPIFFKVAMDVQMRSVVSDVKLQLNESFHNLLEIEKQIIHYLNIIAYQNRIFEKVRKLKYLRDQFLLKENTDILNKISLINPVWMESQNSFRIKLSLTNLQISEVVPGLIEKIQKRRKDKFVIEKNVAGAIPDEYLNQTSEITDIINIQEVYNSFVASGSHLFSFIMNFNYNKKMDESDKILLFCQIAVQYADALNFTETYYSTDIVEYPLIYAK